MRLKVFVISLFASFLLIGCTNNNNEGLNDQNNNDNVEQTRYNDRTNGDNNRGNNQRLTNMRADRDNNNRYEIAEKAADKITERIDEVDYAYVLTTDNNAYVAAVLDYDRNNDNNNRNMNNRNDNNNNNNKNRNNNNRIDVNNNNSDDDFELTDDLKNEIAQIVQSVDNDIDNVFVTTNPDFVDLVNNYVNDVNNGEPIGGFFDQIGNMIDRVFPQNKR